MSFPVKQIWNQKLNSHFHKGWLKLEVWIFGSYRHQNAALNFPCYFTLSINTLEASSHVCKVQKCSTWAKMRLMCTSLLLFGNIVLTRYDRSADSPIENRTIFSDPTTDTSKYTQMDIVANAWPLVGLSYRVNKNHINDAQCTQNWWTWKLTGVINRMHLICENHWYFMSSL